MFQQLFPGAPPVHDYADAMFPNVAHMLIPAWCEEEQAEIFDQSPTLRNAYENGDDAFQNLLTNPFNLHLLAEILLDKTELSIPSTLTTRVELLNLYWQERVVMGDRRWYRKLS